MIRLYTNTDLLTEKNRSYVFPLLFDLHYVKNDSLTSIYTLTSSPAEADVLVMALEFNFAQRHFKKLYKEIKATAKLINKPLWVYTGGDFGYTIKEPLIFNFRLGGFKSTLNSRTFILPSFINDPYQLQLKNGFNPLSKQDIPSIGFVGHANASLYKWLSEIKSYFSINLRRGLKQIYADYQPFFPSSIIRYKYLSKFIKSNVIHTDFILRESYRAGANTEEYKRKSTKEFYTNIEQNSYTLCIRGAGNFSVRFYETLAVGRIPVLIDTDCPLPLNDSIDWNVHCLILKD
ncbi:MAG: glycosyltransferase family 47 protein, partial [Winogradskyella sp.]|nr:glycosyltransferase family 47 protein [Winogradskyella sp.]